MRLPFVLECLGKNKEQFLQKAQDQSKNALKASLAAGFNLWKAEVQQDQTTFEADKLRPGCFFLAPTPLSPNSS